MQDKTKSASPLKLITEDLCFCWKSNFLLEIDLFSKKNHYKTEDNCWLLYKSGQQVQFQNVNECYLLTHHSLKYIVYQTMPLVPSIWQANDPIIKTVDFYKRKKEQLDYLILTFCTFISN
jgi:hypothetical protein